MDRDTIFLYLIAGIALCFGLANGFLLLWKRNMAAKTTGTIISVKTTLPEKTKFRNAKWATVAYNVNGKMYQSQNRIQVPMASQVGTTVSVRYDTRKPEKLYAFSVWRMGVSLLVAAICIAAAVFH